MTKNKSLLAATAIAALLAGPVLAVEVSTDAMLGAAPEDMTTVTLMEDSAFIGNEVRTKDQVVIGQVESVFAGANGEPTLVIAFNNDISAGSSVKAFTVPLTVDAVADGSLTLGWTEAELITALSSNLKSTEGG